MASVDGELMRPTAAPGSASRDRQCFATTAPPISASSTAPTTPGGCAGSVVARGARRSLAKDLRTGDSGLDACSPRMLNRKLLLLQQACEEGHQHHHQHRLQQQQQQQAINMTAAVLNSRRVYPSSRQFVDAARVRGSWDLSDCSNHGSPVVARRVPKKMVVDEKQLALRLMRARNSAHALASSSSSASSTSSSSSSENPSLRASAEAVDSSRRASYTAELVRRGLLAGALSRQQQQAPALLRQGSASSSGGSVGSPESRGPANAARSRASAAAGVAVEEKQALMPCAATGSSGRSSDAEESSRAAAEEEKSALVSPAALLRSASTSSSKLRLKAADMAAAMQEHAFQCAQEVLDGMEKLQCKRVAWVLKKEFDKTYGPAWHCIVGTSFGSYVTHSVGGFLYFSIGKVSVLLFQTAVELIEHH